MLQLLAVDLSAFHRINACGVDACVAENVGKANDILLHRVIGACKEMAQVVRKDLLFGHTRSGTQFFHIRPDVGPIQRLSVLRYENGAAFDIASLHVGAERFTQL